MDERWGEGVGRMTWHPCWWCTDYYFFMSRVMQVQQKYLYSHVLCSREDIWYQTVIPNEKYNSQNVFNSQWISIGFSHTPTVQYVTKKKNPIYNKTRMSVNQIICVVNLCSWLFMSIMCVISCPERPSSGCRFHTHTEEIPPISTFTSFGRHTGTPATSGIHKYKEQPLGYSAADTSVKAFLSFPV